MATDGSVRSVERALSIMECFSQEKISLTLSQIVQEVELPTATVFRLLSTLEKHGYVIRDTSTGAYSLGWKLAKLGDIAFADLDICSIGYPYLEQLHSLYNESFGFYIEQGNQRVCVARIDSTQSLRQSVLIGTARPLDQGASGHILMAYSTTNEAKELANKSKICTPEFLSEVRKQGFSISYGEATEGVTSIAAPVFGGTGELIAALFVTGPNPRFQKDEVEEYIHLLKDFAARISTQLGYRDK